MSFVLDASIALAWLFTDEESEYADWVLGRLDHEDGLAPAHWPLELANGLLVGERRGRISASELVEAVEQTLGLPVILQDLTAEESLGRILQLAREHRLTEYDAAYLDFAMREGLPLATLDNDLIVAARRVGLPELT